ncbi:hypothetical protein [Actinoplanes sp. NPDC049265]|uniref:hypothetical protein n=1 Tax=Actinoplanes sp. NPDC049265 TaxID=3363902 RepID=UPI0037223863
MAAVEVALKEALQIAGATAAAVVDHTSGMALATAGGTRDFDVAVAAAANTDLLRAKLRAKEMLGLSDGIEDILVTLDTQYHLIRPVTGRTGRGLFIYLVLNKQTANLAMARHRLRLIEQAMEL